MANRQGFFTDSMELGFKLPWRVAVSLAAGAFLVFHFIAITTSPPATGTTLAGPGDVVVHQFMHTGALFLQYLLPAGLLIGAVVAFVKQSQAKSLVSRTRARPARISEMSSREFERLVGEAFRQRGFTVTGFGSRGPDGGVDLALVKNGERFLVQCKHGRTQQVGAAVVRELNGIVAAIGAHSGFVVTGGIFTREAREFAQKAKIGLIDGDALEKLLSGTSPTPVPDVMGENAPACPRCGTEMVQRVAKQGRHAGHAIWGCRHYPKCPEIVQISG